MDEQWKSVCGWAGLYEVSNMGRIRSVQREGTSSFGVRKYGGKLINPITHKTTGYLVVNLTNKTIRKQLLLHRIVLESFVGVAPDGFEACHNNGIRTDPRLENLRWDTRKGNHADKKCHGTWQGGEKNPSRKLTEDQARAIKTAGEQIDALAEKYGVSRGCIEKVRYGATWAHV